MRGEHNLVECKERVTLRGRLMPNTSRPAAPTRPSPNAKANAASSTIPPRAVLITIAPGLRHANSSALRIGRPDFGTCTETTSAQASPSASEAAGETVPSGASASFSAVVLRGRQAASWACRDTGGVRRYAHSQNGDSDHRLPPRSSLQFLLHIVPSCQCTMQSKMLGAIRRGRKPHDWLDNPPHHGPSRGPLADAAVH